MLQLSLKARGGLNYEVFSKNESKDCTKKNGGDMALV